jgi:hypothetical protein
VRSLRSASVPKKYTGPTTSGRAVHMRGKLDDANRDTLELHPGRQEEKP